MTDGEPPLKLAVKPDEYLCTWLLPGLDGAVREHAGALDLQAGRPPVGSVHGDVPIRWESIATGRSAGFPQVSHLPHLRARLANGYDVDLVDASVSYWSAEHGRITAASATVGLTAGPRGFGWTAGRVEEGTQPANGVPVPTYPRMSTQVGALDALAGASPFSKWTFPKNNDRKHLEGDWTVTGNPDSSQEWSDDEVNVRLEYDVSISIGNRYAFKFLASPVLRIESRKALSVREWVDQWVTPLRCIASIATGNAQPLTYLSVDSDDRAERDMARFRHRQVFGSGITQEPYQSDQVSVRQAETSVHIAADALSLLDMLRRWQGLASDHHPLIETYGAMLFAVNDHPRSRLLLLVQALEGLYGHRTAAAYEKRTEGHAAKRKTLVEAVEAASILSSKQRNFLKNNLARRPLRGLDEALRTLLGDLPSDLTPELSSSKLLAEYLAKAEGPDTQRVAWALSRVRNDLAHGIRGFDAHDLNDVVCILERVVRAHALRLVGCPDFVLARVCHLD